MPHTKPDIYFFFIIFFTTLSPSSIGFCPAQPKFSPWRWVSAHTSPALLHPPFLRGGPRWTLGPVTLVLRCDGLSSPVTLQHSWSHVSFLVFCPPLPPFFFLFPSLNGFHWIHIDFFFYYFFFIKTLSSHLQLLRHNLDTGCEGFHLFGSLPQPKCSMKTHWWLLATV